jgi:hypothetical protein
MTGKHLKYLAKPVLAMTMLVLASGCGDFGGKPHLPPDEAVKARAEAWADALLAGDLQGAWAYTSPNFRQFSSAKDYSRFVLGSGRWTSAVVDTVHCADDVCEVTIIIEYDIKRMKMTNRRPLDYKWVLVDGDWWLHVPSK